MTTTHPQWSHVTKQNPCPVCSHPDWCMIGTKFVLCNRVESKLLQRGGGWLHLIDDAKPLPPMPKPRPLPTINSTQLMRDWARETRQDWLQELAESLGVSTDSLVDLGAVWAAPHRAWAFPMRDGHGDPVGIRLRSNDGRKWAVRGSRAGIFLPQNSTIVEKTAYLTEGPTDTAAALSLGLWAIGRPSCNCGAVDIAIACRRLGIRRVVMVCDNDEPGLVGAKSVASSLHLPYTFYVPTTKDLREFLKLGGTAQLIESNIRNQCWITPKKQ